MPQLIRCLSKKTITLVAVLALALSAALSMRVSSARASPSDCPIFFWCIWITKDYGAGGGPIYEFDNHYNGTNNWYSISQFAVGASALNNRNNVVWFSHDDVPPNPSAGTKDCMIHGGGRGDLSGWFYPDAAPEWFYEHSLDLIYSGTTC
jgi:hypothetical protein